MNIIKKKRRDFICALCLGILAAMEGYRYRGKNLQAPVYAALQLLGHEFFTYGILLSLFVWSAIKRISGSLDISIILARKSRSKLWSSIVHDMGKLSFSYAVGLNIFRICFELFERRTIISGEEILYLIMLIPSHMILLWSIAIFVAIIRTRWIGSNMAAFFVSWIGMTLPLFSRWMEYRTLQLTELLQIEYAIDGQYDSHGQWVSGQYLFFRNELGCFILLLCTILLILVGQFLMKRRDFLNEKR